MDYRTRNVFMLATAQALMLSAVVVSMTLAGIIGTLLSPDRGLATLPIAAMVVGTALTSIPASLLMRRLGRRMGFVLGAAVGTAGSAVAAYGLVTQRFDWFVVGHLLIGGYQGFANYYRFAAAEAAGPPYASKAISRVVAGGVIAAIAGSTIGYAVMVMAMTATPLAMLGCGFNTSDVKPVIQWHVFGMFAPSFFTGYLVARFGAPRVMQAGFLLLMGHVAIAASGLGQLQFLSALVFLGVGWNFAFVGGTALLTQSYRPSEQTKVQALNEGIVFSLVALASVGAGWLYDRFGWATLNLATLPFLVLALVWTMAAARRP